MPFDGFVTKCISEELNIILTGGRVDKILQPERDEIHLLIRNNAQTHRLLVSSNAAAPRVHLARSAKENPDRAPMFCMVLRKHIGGGRVVGVSSHGFERVVEIQIESANELGDVSIKTLVAEIMGKHSNIILISGDGRIIDSIVHVDEDMNRVRAVMPARPYTPPPPTGKLVPGEASPDAIIERAMLEGAGQAAETTGAALLGTIMGASPLFCRELCRKAGVGYDAPPASVGRGGRNALQAELAKVLGDALSCKYAPCAVGGGATGNFPEGGYSDFYCWKIGGGGAGGGRGACRCAGEGAGDSGANGGGGLVFFDTMSEAADNYYDGRARAASLAQRKAGLSKLVSGHVARCKKKLAIHHENLREAAGRGTYRLYGELITANIHNIKPGDDVARLMNYYDGGYVDIALDGSISPQANAQGYFRKYRKAASTHKNAEIQAGEAEKELAYLESVMQELEMSQNSREIDEIRVELAGQKYVPAPRMNVKSQKAGAGSRRAGELSAPHSFLSSDGLTILVGKNNRQNDQLTLKTASPNDIWLHARNIPGSHVVVKKLQGDVPRRTLAEAASIAAHFSKARMGGNVEVDYTAAKHVRKPSGAKPGMVIYDSQRTLSVKPGIVRQPIKNDQ